MRCSPTAPLRRRDFSLAIWSSPSTASPIESFADMQRIVSASADETLAVTVDRDGATLTLKAVPALKEVQGQLRQRPSHRHSRHQPVDGGSGHEAATGPAAAGRLAGRRGNMVRRRADARLHRRRCSPGGRPRTSSAARSASRRCPDRWRRWASSRCFIWPRCFRSRSACSISFPIPLLDGGHLLFYGIEAMRGRPLSERAQEIGFRIGFAIVLMLMIFATFNDIIHLTTS